MSIRDEIRAAIKNGQPFSAGSILANVPSCEGDRAKLAQNLGALKTEGKIRRAGILDDEAAYALDVWPVSADGGTVRRQRVEKPAKGSPQGRPAGHQGPAQAEIAALRCQIAAQDCSFATGTGARRAGRPACRRPAGRRLGVPAGQVRRHLPIPAARCRAADPAAGQRAAGLM